MDRPLKSRDIVLLGTILLVGLVLRIHGLAAESLWFDEAMGVALGHGTFSAIVEHCAVDEFHPPGYFWLLWAWMQGFGVGEVSARALSVLCGVLAIVPAWMLVRRLLDDASAHLTALLVAVSPMLVYYSQEARPYSLYLLIFLVSAVLFVEAAWERKAWAWWGFVVCAALGTLVYYYMLVALLGFGAAALLLRRRHPLPMGWLLGGAGLFALIVAPWFISEACARQVDFFVLQDRPLSHRRAFDTWKTPFRILNAFHGGTVPFRYAYPPAWTYFAGGLLFGIPALLGLRHARRGSVLLIAALAIVPFAVLFAMTQRGTNLQPRYVFSVIVPYYVLVACGYAALPRVLRALGIAVLLGWSAFGLHLVKNTPSRENWRSAFAVLVRELRPGDAVVFLPYGGAPLEWGIYHPGAPPLPIVGLERAVEDFECERLWLLSFERVPVDRPGAAEARAAIEQRFREVRREPFFQVTLTLHAPRER